MKALGCVEENNIYGAALALGCKNPMLHQEFNLVWSEINYQRWEMPTPDYTKLDLTEEQIQGLLKSDITYCLLKDFDAYAVDFIRFYNINLYTQDIDLLQFQHLLAGLFNYDSVLKERVKIRCSKYNPRANVVDNVNDEKLRQKYSLD